jgi:hypothetical protein
VRLPTQRRRPTNSDASRKPRIQWAVPTVSTEARCRAYSLSVVPGLLLEGDLHQRDSRRVRKNMRPTRGDIAVVLLRPSADRGDIVRVDVSDSTALLCHSHGSACRSWTEPSVPLDDASFDTMHSRIRHGSISEDPSEVRPLAKSSARDLVSIRAVPAANTPLRGGDGATITCYPMLSSTICQEPTKISMERDRRGR